MNCMKCGKEAPEGQVFCDGCLDSMQAYPVKPGTPIQLPSRKPTAQEKHAAPLEQTLTPAMQVRQLQRMVRWLTAIIAILSVLLCGTAVMLLHTLEDPAVSNIGKNYTTTGTQNRP